MIDWNALLSGSEWRELAHSQYQLATSYKWLDPQFIRYLAERLPANCSELVDVAKWRNEWHGKSP